MKTKTRHLISWLVVSAVLLIGYFLSFVYFVRCHEWTGLRGPPGQALTITVVVVPDTLTNRVLVVFYTPLFRCLFVRSPIEWSP